jgi:hypothetical protein
MEQRAVGGLCTGHRHRAYENDKAKQAQDVDTDGVRGGKKDRRKLRKMLPPLSPVSQNTN